MLQIILISILTGITWSGQGINIQFLFSSKQQKKNNLLIANIEKKKEINNSFKTLIHIEIIQKWLLKQINKKKNNLNNTKVSKETTESCILRRIKNNLD